MFNLFKREPRIRNADAIYGDELLNPPERLDVVDVGRYLPLLYEVPVCTPDDPAAFYALGFISKYKDMTKPIAPPPIRYMGMARLNDVMGSPNRSINTDGVYMTTMREIWIGQQPTDRLWQMSVLVHEMTHHVQYSERAPNAPVTGDQYIADEVDAFAIQRAWLLSQGYHIGRGVDLVRKPWDQVVADIHKSYAPMLAAHGLTTSKTASA